MLHQWLGTAASSGGFATSRICSDNRRRRGDSYCNVQDDLFHPHEATGSPRLFFALLGDQAPSGKVKE
jgi:hypothetical protein